LDGAFLYGGSDGATHKGPKMTQRYAHLRDEALKKASDLAGDLVNQALKADQKIVALEE